jgi:hypothetical protein
MAKGGRSSGTLKVVINDVHRKGTTIGRGKIKMSTMNKRKKASYKKYRGQGRP